MVACCANPSCKREFRQLSKGRLFLLPPVLDLGDSLCTVPKLIDHCYWLCPECARTHTILLDNSKPVVTRTETEAVAT